MTNASAESASPEKPAQRHTPHPGRGAFFLETVTGQTVHIFKPAQREISIVDIAYALGHIGRFNGHCRPFYSVAQHSVYVSSFCRPEIRKEALMTNAFQAYIAPASWPTLELPIFRQGYELVKGPVEEAIRKRFQLRDLDVREIEDIRVTKLRVRANEHEHLGFVYDWGNTPTIEQLDKPFKAWSPRKASSEFMKTAFLLGLADSAEVTWLNEVLDRQW